MYNTHKYFVFGAMSQNQQKYYQFKQCLFHTIEHAVQRTFERGGFM